MFALVWVLHHRLHVFLHLGEIALRSQYSDKQQVLCAHVLMVIWLQLSGLLLAFVKSFLGVANEEWCFDHIKDVEIFFHV